MEVARRWKMKKALKGFWPSGIDQTCLHDDKDENEAPSTSVAPLLSRALEILVLLVLNGELLGQRGAARA